MPDISMCPSTICVAKASCYRNEASGTIPNKGRQSYAGFDDGKGYNCDNYRPTKGKEDVMEQEIPKITGT